MVSDSGGGRAIEGEKRRDLARASLVLCLSCRSLRDFPDIFPVNFPLRARSSLDAFSISLALPPLTRPDASSAVRSARSRISERRAGDVDDTATSETKRIYPIFLFLLVLLSPWPISFRRDVRRGVNNREKCLRAFSNIETCADCVFFFF